MMKTVHSNNLIQEKYITLHSILIFLQTFSLLGIDNVIEGPQELHVNIPEEQQAETSDIETNTQPPSYQEAISSQDNPANVESKD